MPDEPPRMHASSRGGNDEQHTLILMLDDPLRKPADAGYSLQDSTEQLQQRLRGREVLSHLLLGRLQLNAVAEVGEVVNTVHACISANASAQWQERQYR